MFVDAGVDKIRLTGGEVRIVHEPTGTGINHISISDRDFRACPCFYLCVAVILSRGPGAAWNGQQGARLGVFI